MFPEPPSSAPRLQSLPLIGPLLLLLRWLAATALAYVALNG